MFFSDKKCGKQIRRRCGVLKLEICVFQLIYIYQQQIQ